jgi:hypothetical protein
MRVEPPRQLNPLRELLPPERLEALLSERQPSVDKLDVRALAEGVGDDSFVLFGRDGAGRVDDVTALFGGVGDGVDGAEEELLLEVAEEHEVTLGLWKETKISAKKSEEAERRERTLLTLTDGSFEMTPVPEQGASRRTRSNPPMILGNSRPSTLVITTFLHPRRATFPPRPLIRPRDESFAQTSPVLPMRADM